MQLTPRLVLMLATPPAMWASNAVVGRMAIGSIDPLWLNALRWIVAFALLLPLGWAAIGTAAARAEIAARWKYLAVIGIIGVGAYNALQYMALRTSTPLNVTLIASSSPVWAMVVGAVGFKVHPTRLQLIGAVLSLCGVALVMSRGNPAALADVRFVQGDLLMLIAIIGWSLYSWMLAKPPAHMQGAARPGWNWAQFLVAQAIFGVSGAVATAVVGDLIAPSAPTQWSWQLIATILFVAIGPSIIAYRLWGLAVAEAGPAMASIFYNLTPLFAAVLSAVVIGEGPQPFHGVAFGLIVAGIAVSSRSSARASR
ncbi:DMT family transporter [Zoogloea sp.]|uniref:DMT family transporter n=1 Tax=Zoogloea sp. TaxID=49181 RepID=UPI0035B0D0D3